MKHWIFPLVFGFALTSHAELTNDQRVEKLQKGVEQGNVEWVREAFVGLKDPFKKARGLFGGESGVFAGMSSERLLDQSLKPRPCRDEVVLVLLQNGAVMGDSYELYKKTSEQGCAKSVKYLLESKDEALSSNAAATFFKTYEKEMVQIIRATEQNSQPNAEPLERLQPVLKVYETFLKEKCKEPKGSSAVCMARAEYDQMQTNVKSRAGKALTSLETQEEEEKQMESPEGIAAQICEVDESIAEARAKIDRQKKIGKVSGTVDMSVLNRAGARIVDLEEQRKGLIADFKRATGKVFKSVSCK